MWLQAALSLKDLTVFANKLFPVHLALESGDAHGRHIYLGKPRTFELVADQGLRVEMRARVRWPLLGVAVPIDVPSVTAMLRIKLLERHGEDVFAFVPELEALDVSMLPGFVDRGLKTAINKAIATDLDRLSWRFTHSLDFVIPMPEADVPPRRLHLAAKWGDVVVTAEGVQLVATFDADLSERQATPPSSVNPPPPAPAPRTTSGSDGQSPSISSAGK
jgi:hypothetical protein